MSPLIETVDSVASNQAVLRNRAYGMIEAAGGKLIRIRLKPWPKIASLLEARWLQSMKSSRQPQDVCRLYYNQPLGHRNYLTLAYVESSLATRTKTFYATLEILDQIAFIKRSDAILAEVTNPKITDRHLVRLGWERHRPDSPKRHWIKRFYGQYPAKAVAQVTDATANR